MICRYCLAKMHGHCAFIVLPTGDTELCGCACTPALIARRAAVGDA